MIMITEIGKQQQYEHKQDNKSWIKWKMERKKWTEEQNLRQHEKQKMKL